MTKSQLVEALNNHRNRAILFEAIESIGHAGFYEWDDRVDQLISCSAGYARIFGMNVEEVMTAQSSWDELRMQIYPDDWKEFAKSLQTIRKGNSHDFEYRIIRKDGEIRNIRDITARIIDARSGEPSIHGIVQDITDSKKHEIELENRDVLAQQAESITDIGHFIYDLVAGEYAYISPGFARIHGVSRDEYLARANSAEDDIADVHADDCPRIAEIYKQHSRNGKEFSIDYRILRVDGEIRWIREQCTAHRIVDGVVQQAIGVLQDITEQKNTEANLLEANESLEVKVKLRTRELANTVSQLKAEVEEREKMAVELEFLANHDALTGLPSLRLCKDRLEHSLAESRRNKQKSAVMFVDLDRFKEVNDQYGHEYGDAVLKVVADRISAEIRETDTVARIGGDEFVIILSSLPDLETVERIATQVIDRISTSIYIDRHDVEVSASIGIAIYPDDGSTPDELIRQADRAMYLVKDSGKNSFGFIAPVRLN